MDVAPVCKQFNIPLISDGGNKCSGNMAKALAIGADCVMLGRYLKNLKNLFKKINI